MDEFPEPPLRYHVEELRKRVLRSLVAVALASSVAFPYSDEMLRRAVHELVPNTVRVIVTGPIEPLWARLELSLLVGLLVTLPYLIYEGYRYIRPSLYKEEACVVRYMLPCSYLLFLIGAAFSYIVLKVSIRVLYSFAPGVGAEPFMSLEEFVSFVVTVIFIMGIVFQLPLITYLAARSGLIDPETLKRRRKEVCVAVLTIAGVVTPDPTPCTQVLVSVPVLLLYEVGLLTAKKGVKRG
ncbi:twin-arginine translocase subunit TatC [Methanopyrus sp.]